MRMRCTMLPASAMEPIHSPSWDRSPPRVGRPHLTRIAPPLSPRKTRSVAERCAAWFPEGCPLGFRASLSAGRRLTLCFLFLFFLDECQQNMGPRKKTMVTLCFSLFFSWMNASKIWVQRRISESPISLMIGPSTSLGFCDGGQKETGSQYLTCVVLPIKMFVNLTT